LIAEIRRDGGALHVGEVVRLSAAEVNDTQAKFSWRLVSRPEDSRAKLSDHTKGTTSFVADVPGVFAVQLTVQVRSERATATLRLTLTDAPTPVLVPVNTIDFDDQGNPGITVGSTFYPDPGKGKGLQILVLNRNDPTEMISNTSTPLTLNGIEQINFSGFDNGTLVVVSLAASAAPIPPSLIQSLSDALAPIGGVLPPTWLLQGPISSCSSLDLQNCYSGDQWSKSYRDAGSFSIIGMPGMAAGQAWYNSAAQRGTQQGALVGYLTQGQAVGGGTNANAYVFVFGADQYVIVDSCVSGGPKACAIGVGTQTFPPQTGVNGLNVVLLDRVTLQPIVHQTVTSTTALAQALAGIPGLGPSGHYQLGPGGGPGISSDRVVAVIQSVGTLSPNFIAVADDGALQLIDQLGGTPETFQQAIAQGQAYALVGVASKLPWHGRGIESSPVISSALGLSQTLPGRSRGVLWRDRMARYTPGANDPLGQANLALAPIVYQDPTPWPYAGNCGISYIASQLEASAKVTLPPDIRSAYIDRGLPWDSSQMNPNDPRNVSYPLSPQTQPCQPFPSLSDFSLIQAQLSNEFEWVTQVWTFIGALQAPFGTASGDLGPVVGSVADTIRNSLNTPSTANTTMGWLDIFDGVIATAAEATGDPVLGTMAAAGAVGILLMQQSEGASNGAGSLPAQIQAEASQLAIQLQAQFNAHFDALANLGAILVSDAGKLQTVGTNTLDPSSGWSWTANPDTAGDAVNALNSTTASSAYSALLPPTWPLWNLKPDLKTQFSSADVNTFGCGYDTGDGGPFGVSDLFKGALDDNQFHSVVQMLPGQETSINEVWSFATFHHNSEDVLVSTLPSGSLTTTGATPLFSTGPNGAAAYKPAWYRSTYNPPSLIICGTEAKEGQTVLDNPAVIGPPEAADTLG
jgi:hypothetical protein